MGVGISRWNVTSCGAFRRTSSDLQDASTYKRLMVDRDNHDNASIDSRFPPHAQKNYSSLPKKDAVSPSLPKKDVVNEEKKTTYVNDIYRQLDEELEKNTPYDGPMFMKSPSFRDFIRPIERPNDTVMNACMKEEETRETNKTESPNSVCTEEACTREETENEMNKEAGPAKEKRIYKIFSQYYKPSTVTGGVRNLFIHPKPKPSN